MQAFVKAVRRASRGWIFGQNASLTHVASRQGERSASEMQSFRLDYAGLKLNINKWSLVIAVLRGSSLRFSVVSLVRSDSESHGKTDGHHARAWPVARTRSIFDAM